jgi:acetyl/propionyl-CoA carboxylase alpha subunit
MTPTTTGSKNRSSPAPVLIKAAAGGGGGERQAASGKLQAKQNALGVASASARTDSLEAGG